MSMAASLSAWKWVLVLLLALGASVWLNLVQWRNAATAPLHDEIAGKDQALEDSAALLQARDESARRLAQAADRAAGQLSNASSAYRAAAAERPITDPACAPGQGRIDAVNSAAGAKG